MGKKTFNLNSIILIVLVVLGLGLGWYFLKDQVKQEIKKETITLVKDEANKVIKDKVGIDLKSMVNKSQIVKDKFNNKNVPQTQNTTQNLDLSQAQPKGNKQEFCGVNTFNGVVPTVSKGFGNDLIYLCYSGYTAQYNPSWYISLWTAEKLTKDREKRSQNGEREDSFYQDPTIVAKFGDLRAVETSDYIGASNGAKSKADLIRYDRGHLAPSRDMPLDDRYESYYMTNIVPQSAENNRNIWKNIESLSRCYASKYGEAYVVNVPVVDINYYRDNKLPMNKLLTKRGHKIQIPDYMAKGIYIPSLNQIGVFLTKNNKDKTGYEMISVNQLKKLAYIDIFPQLSEDLKNTVNLNNDCQLKLR